MSDTIDIHEQKKIEQAAISKVIRQMRRSIREQIMNNSDPKMKYILQGLTKDQLLQVSDFVYSFDN